MLNGARNEFEVKSEVRTSNRKDIDNTEEEDTVGIFG